MRVWGVGYVLRNLHNSYCCRRGESPSLARRGDMYVGIKMFNRPRNGAADKEI